MVRAGVHELLKEGKIEEIFRGFKAQFDNAQRYGWKEGERKAISTAQRNNKGELLIHLLAKDGNGRDLQRTINFGHPDDLNIKVPGNNLALIHYAIKSNNIEIINHVVRLGVNIKDLPGGVEGLIKHAQNDAIKKYLQSNEFKELVDIFSGKAKAIVAGKRSREEERRKSISENTGQALISSFVKKDLNVRVDNNVAVDNNTLATNNAMINLSKIRETFRNASQILREQQERGDLEQAFRDPLLNIPTSSSSSSSSNKVINDKAMSKLIYDLTNSPMMRMASSSVRSRSNSENSTISSIASDLGMNPSNGSTDRESISSNNSNDYFLNQEEGRSPVRKKRADNNSREFNNQKDSFLEDYPNYQQPTPTWRKRIEMKDVATSPLVGR